MSSLSTSFYASCAVYILDNVLSIAVIIAATYGNVYKNKRIKTFAIVANTSTIIATTSWTVAFMCQMQSSAVTADVAVWVAGVLYVSAQLIPGSISMCC